MIRVLFVCLGNICRSPTAHGVLLSKIRERRLQSRVEVDSAGTAAWHTGKAPDPRSQQAAAGRGYDLSALRARQAVADDFRHFDYVLAMDEENLLNLNRLYPGEGPEPELFLQRFGRRFNVREVPDPYYGGDTGFQHVLDLIEDACDGLLDDIEDRLKRA
ncbi:low molecular weight protein-tyrosine-phosphatase [Thalassolituus sp. LLYu03]|uniref:low molecular weight protein-tyrosine-phosphatase n=1 Tax=Thalassolituus sp. LLYu03 TaxID=3421656 RepID=UPI003D27EB4B